MITNLKNIKPFIEKSMPFILTAILIVTTGVFGYHIWHAHKKHSIEQTYRTAVPAPTNYYVIDGPAQDVHNVADDMGNIGYCPLDDQSRPTCAVGLLSTHTRAEAKERDRQSIEIDPAGWPNGNEQVTIDSNYGWFWNRSYLLPDSLGGKPVKGNIITGTLAQNVGATSAHNGGMAYVETLAQQYLDDPSHDSCPLYYAAKPKYDGDSPIPSIVTIDIESCDRSLSQHVIVFNTANGYTIDYSDGSFRPIER